MKPKYCQYCGELLNNSCDCQDLKEKSHLFDFLLLEYDEDSEFQLSYSEERAMLEYAEHRLG